jgi:hypothetical protein
MISESTWFLEQPRFTNPIVVFWGPAPIRGRRLSLWAIGFVGRGMING